MLVKKKICVALIKILVGRGGCSISKEMVQDSLDGHEPFQKHDPGAIHYADSIKTYDLT